MGLLYRGGEHRTNKSRTLAHAMKDNASAVAVLRYSEHCNGRGRTWVESIRYTTAENPACGLSVCLGIARVSLRGR